MPKSHLNMVTLLLLMAGIEPGPPVQQATALSITPLHLGWHFIYIEQSIPGAMEASSSYMVFYCIGRARNTWRAKRPFQSCQISHCPPNS